MFNNKKRIKELEKFNENLHGHLEYSQSVVREKNDEIDELNAEIERLKTLIADKFIECCDKSKL